MRSIAALFFAGLVWGQTPPAQTVEQVLHFSNLNRQSELQEMWNIMRTGADVRDVSMDLPGRSLTIHATPSQVVLAQWLAQELDKPEGWLAAPGQAAPAYHYAAGGMDTEVRIFYMTHPDPPYAVQELQNVMRTGADINRVFPFMSLRAIVVRSTPEQVALGEWLFRQGDQIPLPGQRPAAYTYQSPYNEKVQSPAVRVFFLTNIDSAAKLQDMQTSLRTVARINRVFPITARWSFVVRGAADEVATGEWLVNQLDRPATAPAKNPAPEPFAVPGSADAVRLYALSYMSDAAVQQLQKSSDARSAYLKALHILAFRGTAGQLAVMDKLVAERDQPGQ